MKTKNILSDRNFHSHLPKWDINLLYKHLISLFYEEFDVNWNRETYKHLKKLFRD